MGFFFRHHIRSLFFPLICLCFLLAPLILWWSLWLFFKFCVESFILVSLAGEHLYKIDCFYWGGQREYYLDLSQCFVKRCGILTPLVGSVSGVLRAAWDRAQVECAWCHTWYRNMSRRQRVLIVMIVDIHPSLNMKVQDGENRVNCFLFALLFF